MDATKPLAEDKTIQSTNKPIRPAVSKVHGLKQVLLLVKKCFLIALNVWGVTKGRPPGPIYAQIGIADPCNHKCVMCPDHPGDENVSPTTEAAFALPPGMMSLTQYKEIIDDYESMETYRIELVGQGEPMLNKHAVEMMSYAKSKGMFVRMVSNGSRIFEKEAEAMVDCGMDHLQISLNAGKPMTYPLIHVTESPEKYIKLKSNLRYLTDYKRSRNSQLPHLRLGFVISNRNCFELKEMIEAAHEIGADEARFEYASVHEGTQDIRLTEEDFQKVKAMIPEAQELAEKLGVEAGLNAFAASQPPYLEEEVLGDSVVPCYVGWYFGRVIGNGSVLPCCQCPNPLAVMDGSERYKDLWGSKEYDRFRDAARALPAQNDMLNNCECNQCAVRPRNITVHNLLYPFRKIKGVKKNMLYKLKDLFKSRFARF